MIERLTPREYEKRQISDLPAPEAWLDKELKEQAEKRAYVYGDSPEEPAPKEEPPTQYMPVAQAPSETRIPFSVFYEPHQPREPLRVEPGQSKVVYEFELPSDYVGFIYDLATVRYPNTYIDWEINGEVVERLHRQVGEFERPKVYDPPYFVREKIRFIAYNNDTSAHDFEVLCNGLLIKKIT